MVEKTIDKQDTKYELFNCGAGRAYSIAELADYIMAVNDKFLKLEYNTSKPNIPTVVILNCDKAKEKLGWEPKTNILEAFKKTSNWYKANYKGSTFIK
jgi:nucleoside-diphosphate-sugar epimerase